MFLVEEFEGARESKIMTNLSKHTVISYFYYADLFFVGLPLIVTSVVFISHTLNQFIGF